MIEKLIGIALLVFVVWLIRRLTTHAEPNKRTTSDEERARLRDEARRKPYSPRFTYEPPKSRLK